MIILASNSPRRKQLLAFGGLPFIVQSVQIDEAVCDGEEPGAYVLRLSQEKAEAARANLYQAFRADDMIISADTSVVLELKETEIDVAKVLPEFRHLRNDQKKQYIILGKPSDDEHATQILQILRNRTHQVYTGLTVLRIGDGFRQHVVCITQVPMRDYQDDEIQSYIASGDPFDKAGAYAIQHKGFHPAQQLQGCFANVMGLPVCHLAVLLRRFGLFMHPNIADHCLKEFDYVCPIYSQVFFTNWDDKDYSLDEVCSD